MEPQNYPIEKENHLPNLPFLASIFIFQGVLQIIRFSSLLIEWLANAKQFRIRFAKTPGMDKTESMPMKHKCGNQRS